MNQQLRNIYSLECWRNGKKIWEEKDFNLITNEGVDNILQEYLKGSAYTASFFAGLKGSGTPAVTDTLSSHPSWNEVTDYTGTRKTIVLGTVSGGAVDNSASRAQFDITGTATVAGVFVCTVASGTAGVLYGVADFGAPRAVEASDTLIVTTAFTAASV